MRPDAAKLLNWSNVWKMCSFLIESQSQATHCKNSEAIPVDDFPHYVQNKEKKDLEEEHKVMVSLINYSDRHLFVYVLNEHYVEA